MSIDTTGEPVAKDEPAWRFEVRATEKASGQVRLIGRASDRGGADAIVAGAKATDLYRDVKLHDLREQLIEEDFL
jgi:hypothetical protein